MATEVFSAFKPMIEYVACNLLAVPMECQRTRGRWSDQAFTLQEHSAHTAVKISRRGKKKGLPHLLTFAVSGHCKG